MSTVANWFFGQSTAEALFPPERGKLHIVGEHFYTEENELWQWRGYSWFLGYRRFCNGEDVTGDLRWLRAHGFNLVRVFGPLNWKETPDYTVEHFQFDVLGAFFDLLAYHGLRCEFVPGCYLFDGWPAFLQKCYDIAAGHWNVLLERVNEPSVGKKPDPLAKVDERSVLSAYGIYTPYTGTYPTLDYSTIHTQRDDAWHRKARHAQEVQHKTGKPCISDEPAKAIEPDFNYPGGKRNPDEFVWHHGVCALWTAGSTLHTEEGKWGRVPVPGMRQYEIVEAVRDDVWLKIGPEWQTGDYAGAHMSKSPVDGKGLKINGKDIWTYSSVHDDKALAVRCAVHAPQPKPGWTVVDRWAPGGSIVQLKRGT